MFGEVIVNVLRTENTNLFSEIILSHAAKNSFLSCFQVLALFIEKTILFGIKYCELWGVTGLIECEWVIRFKIGFFKLKFSALNVTENIDRRNVVMWCW
jgi:hypothetical protein